MSWLNPFRPRSAPLPAPSPRRHGRRRPAIHEFFSYDRTTKKRGWSAFADHDRKKGLKLAAACGLALTAGGCGFQPLYATDGSARGQLARIHIDQIADRTGQQLRNALLLSFPPGDPTAPAAWRLRVTLKEAKRELGVEKRDVATRANLTLTAFYTLEDAASDKPVMSGDLRSVNSYNILQSPYGTLAAERNARARAVSQIADGLTARLATWLSRPRNGRG